MSANGQLEVALRLQLDRFELQVEFQTSARVIGIFGPSGCGKTSLLESIAGLRPGAQGHVRWNQQNWPSGKGLRPVPSERRQIGYVPQEGLLFPRRSVRANLRAGRRRALERGLDFEASLQNSIELLELMPLLDQSVETLSGGERQRVALARAICSGPRFLLLDEPLSGLDLPLRRRLLPYLQRVAHELELPILLVSHDPIEVQALCEHLVVLSEGRVLASGEPQQVLTRADIFPLASSAGFENVLRAEVCAQHANSSELQLGAGPDAPKLVAPRTQLKSGQCLLLGIRADDIILATLRPTHISARNILQARITHVEDLGDKRLVSAQTHPSVAPICVEVTAMTAADLELRAGTEVFLLIKTVACRLYDSVPTLTGPSIRRDSHSPSE